ncbi:hypothetical protein CBS101457_003190 [Exobasidium rhododendri]|nr:hypothetical protein CBS101457_003190 [Exobasidium rhododendri]
MRRKAKTSILLLLIPFLLVFFTVSFLYYYQHPHPSVHPTVGDRSYPFGVDLGPSVSTIMTAPFSLSTSLRDKKAAILERLSQPPNDAAPFVIIMGNEAGDTDSLASSILLSHLLSSSPLKSTQLSKFSRSTTFVPLSQLPRADLKLRAENEMLLSLSQMDASDLLFLDDLPSQDKLLRSDVFFGLTDHPQLSNYWQPYEQFVQRVEVVVDHHADEGAHEHAKLRVIKGPNNGAVGSAVSVVVDLFKDEEGIKHLHHQLADLSLAAILIDTDDLRPAPKGKATPIDLESAKTLLNQSSLNSVGRTPFIQAATKAGGKVASDVAGSLPEEDDEMSIEASSVESPKTLEAASSFYRILTAKKQDVSRLDTNDLLRRDYKENTIKLSDRDLRAGFASVPVGLSDWVHERHASDTNRWDGFWSAIADWMKQRELDVAVVGTSFQEGSLNAEEKGAHKRELILAYKEKATFPNLFPALVKYLESDAYAAEQGDEPSLQLKLDHPWKGWRRIEETGKKERIASIGKDGKWTGDENVKVAVWLQRNGRASRKIYLPAVVHALRKAAKAK